MGNIVLKTKLSTLYIATFLHLFLALLKKVDKD